MISVRVCDAGLPAPGDRASERIAGQSSSCSKDGDILFLVPGHQLLGQLLLRGRLRLVLLPRRHCPVSRSSRHLSRQAITPSMIGPDTVAGTVPSIGTSVLPTASYSADETFGFTLHPFGSVRGSRCLCRLPVGESGSPGCGVAGSGRVGGRAPGLYR